MVGAVITHGDRIIGEGFTSPYGGPHAEVNAIRAVIQPELLREATLYVTLEPCCHYGKTPPCTDLIVQSALKRHESRSLHFTLDYPETLPEARDTVLVP